jgi:integrase
MFYLWGINLIDLFNLTDKNMVNGRIEYIRAKTGKFYSVKVEPETLEIIERYKGEKYLINIHDRYKNHKDYMKHLNKGLSKIGPVIKKSANGVPVMKPICSDLTTYWARHTWATIAAELDIPKETIAAGLGHEIGNDITSIYIDFNMKKVDDANRKIINYANPTKKS